MGDARKVKQDVISSLGKEEQDIRNEELSGFGQAAIKAGQAIMKAPNIVAAKKQDSLYISSNSISSSAKSKLW